MTSTSTIDRYRTRSHGYMQGSGWRLLAMLMLSLNLVGGLCTALLVEQTKAASLGTTDSTQYLNARYEVSTTYMSPGVNEVRYCVQPANSRCLYTSLGGNTDAAPRIGTDKANRFLVVAARGTDGALYVRVKIGTGAFGAWQNLGGVVVGSPVVFGGNGHVDVTVTGTDGKRYTKRSSDGVNFVGPNNDVNGWFLFNGGNLPAGVNFLHVNDWTTQLTLYRQLAPDIARVNMKYSRTEANIFRASHLTDILASGVRTILIRTADADYTGTDVLNMLNEDIGGVTLLQYIQQHGDNNEFFIEIGNEPDHTCRFQHELDGPTPDCPTPAANGPERARDQALDVINTLRANGITCGSSMNCSTPGLRLMVNMNTSTFNNGAHSQDYFNRFNSAAPNGQRIVDVADAVSAHAYASGIVYNSSAGRNVGVSYYQGATAAGSPLVVVGWLKAITSKPIYVTEWNLNSCYSAGCNPDTQVQRTAQLTTDMVELDADVPGQPAADGQIRGVMIYATDQHAGQGSFGWYNKNGTAYAIDINTAGTQDYNYSGAKQFGNRPGGR